MDRCPTCGTAVNQKSHKALCTHLYWKPGKRAGWMLKKESTRTISAQEQKYKLNPMWRRSLAGRKGEMR